MLRQQQTQAQADLGTLVGQPLHSVSIDFVALPIDDVQRSSSYARQSMDRLADPPSGDGSYNHVADALQQLIAEAEACNPTLKGLAAEIARDRSRQQLACLQAYPDFTLGVGYSIISDGSDVISPVANGRDNINFGVGMTLPIWRAKISAGVRQAAHQRSSTMHRYAAEQDRLRGRLRREVAAADAAIQQLELFRKRLIPRTEQALKIATADYQGEKADFTDLVDVYQELLAYQTQVARTTAAFAATLARIEQLVGCATTYVPDRSRVSPERGARP